MGAKTGLLAHAAQGVIPMLRDRPAEAGRERAEALLRRIYPDWLVGH